MYLIYIINVINKGGLKMELLQKKKQFKNDEGQVVEYDVFYVKCYGTDVELNCKYKEFKELLKNAFEKGE